MFHRYGIAGELLVLLRTDRGVVDPHLTIFYIWAKRVRERKRKEGDECKKGPNKNKGTAATTTKAK